MGGSGDLFMIIGLGIAGYFAWQHKDEIKAMLTPQTAAAVAPAPVAPTGPAEPLQAACCVCHAADDGFECLVVADPGKVYKYKKANTVQEATAQCIVDHCAGADKDDEGNDLPPRENRRVSKGGADETTDLLNKRINEQDDDDDDDDDAPKMSQHKLGPNTTGPQKDDFMEQFNRNVEAGKRPGAPSVSTTPKTNTGTQGSCPAGHYMLTKPCPAGYSSDQKCVECRKLSTTKYATATDIYSRPISYYGNMGQYSAYESRMKWKGGRGGGRDDDHHDRDRDHHWDNKHVWRMPRPIVRSNVVVYNPFAYYYAPPPPMYYPPAPSVYPFAYW